jgi:hypothetical protein
LETGKSTVLDKVTIYLSHYAAEFEKWNDKIVFFTGLF